MEVGGPWFRTVEVGGPERRVQRSSEPMEPILSIVAIGGLAVELEVNLYVSRGVGYGLMRPFSPGISGQQPEITGLCSVCPVREGRRSFHFEPSPGHSTRFPSENWVEGRGWSREEEESGG